MKQKVLVSIFVIVLVLQGCATGSGMSGVSTSEITQQPEVSAGGNTDNAAVFDGIIEPEQLISKEEAAQIVGAVNDGEKKEQAARRQKTIVYNAAGGKGFLQVSLSQDTFMTDVDHTSADIYLTMKEGLGSKDAETVEGIGSEYFFGTPGLHILYKGYYIVVAAGKLSDPGVKDLLKQAAVLAVNNLDKILSK